MTDTDGSVTLFAYDTSGQESGTTYNVYRSDTLPVPRDSAHRIASGLTPGGLYNDSGGEMDDYYVVTAVNSYGESGPSNTAQAYGTCQFNCDPTLTSELTMETTTITRTTYTLAGQPIATEVEGDPNNDGLFYVHTDH
ncbi:MAG: hypothetical protein ACOC8X_13765, partial [Chloroflexota bacterium]